MYIEKILLQTLNPSTCICAIFRQTCLKYQLKLVKGKKNKLHYGHHLIKNRSNTNP